MYLVESHGFVLYNEQAGLLFHLIHDMLIFDHYIQPLYGLVFSLLAPQKVYVSFYYQDKLSLSRSTSVLFADIDLYLSNLSSFLVHKDSLQLVLVMSQLLIIPTVSFQ